MLLNLNDDLSSGEIVKSRLAESVEIKKKIINDQELIAEIVRLAEDVAKLIKSGGKILICGNGGSASDALHIAGELVGRFQMERSGYAAIALNADVATMTAIANDYGFNQIFSRQVEGILNKGDILIGISTSGNSPNIIAAFDKAHEKGGYTALLSGGNGGELKGISDYKLIVPSDVTARIQEGHICIYHIICEIVEMRLKKGEGR